MVKIADRESIGITEGGQPGDGSGPGPHPSYDRETRRQAAAIREGMNSNADGVVEKMSCYSVQCGRPRALDADSVELVIGDLEQTSRSRWRPEVLWCSWNCLAVAKTHLAPLHGGLSTRHALCDDGGQQVMVRRERRWKAKMPMIALCASHRVVESRHDCWLIVESEEMFTVVGAPGCARTE